MIIEFGGVEYDYDPDRIDVPTAIAIQKHTGLGMRSWEQAIDDGQPAALQALLWAMKRQGGENVPIATLNFSVTEFYRTLREASMQELTERVAQAIEAGEDPETVADPTVTAE